MRVGDIVKVAATTQYPTNKPTEPVQVPGGIIRAESIGYSGTDIYVNGYQYRDREVEFLTVADLFREAGLPVPEGASIHVSGCDLTWWAMGPDTNDYGDFGCLFRFVPVEDGYMWLIQTDDPKDCEATLEVDLSRLPAADAWDCLPEGVKAVVR